MKTFQQLQEEIRLVEASTKGVVFMFGRFNPPTLGHEKMVKRAVQVAKRAGIRDVRLYPSFTQDAKRNPLSHRDKVKLLRKFFKGVKVVDDKDARTPFAVARKLSDQGFKKVIMIAGGDRIKEFQSQISKYIKHPDPDKSFEFDEFQVVSAGERDPDAEDASGMSASKMRAFAAVKDFGNFIKGMPSRAKESDARAMFALLRKSMNLKESTLRLSAEQRDATFAQRLRDLTGPDMAEDGKCYAVVWADGRGVVAYRNRADAVRFVEQGDRDVVSVRYRDAARESGRSLIVRNSFSPDRSSIEEEWPDTLNEGFRLAWWYNARTKKFIEVAGRFSTHSDVIFAAPEKLGLTEKDTRTSSGRPVDPDVTVKLLKKRGWAELSLTENVTSKGQDEANIRTNSNREAQEALNWILNTFRPSLERVFIQNLKSPKNVFLEGSHQIKQFAKTGKVIKQTEIGATMARFR